MSNQAYAGLVLSELLFAPRTYVERRVESYILPSHRMFQWNIEQQVRIPAPEVPSGLDPGDEPFALVVSLGLYEKSRTPDLVARQGSAKIPVLSRRPRGQRIAIAMLQHYIERVPYNGKSGIAAQVLLKAAVDPKRLTSDENHLWEILKSVSSTIEDVVISAEKQATDRINHLEGELKDSWPELLESENYFDDPDQSFLEQLRALAGTTHLLAEVRARKGEAISLEISYSALVDDPLEVDTAREADAMDGNFAEKAADSILSAGNHAVRKRFVPLHRRLGLLPTKLAKPAHMADHCLSFYLLAGAPEGLEIRRSYWSDVRFPNKEAKPDAYYDSGIESEGAVLSIHRSDDADCRGFPAVAVYELSIRRRGWLRLVWFQVLLILLLSLLFAAGTVDQSTPNQTFIFGLPGTIAGFISLTRHEYTTRIVGWLRSALVGLSLLSLGFVLGLSLDMSAVPLASSLPTASLYTATTAALSALLLVIVGWLTFGGDVKRTSSAQDTYADVRQAVRTEQARVTLASGLGILSAILMWILVYRWMS